MQCWPETAVTGLAVAESRLPAASYEERAALEAAVGKDTGDDMRVRASISISIDGFGAGPEQSRENPLGKRGLELHQWIFGTRMFQAMRGKSGGSEGVDDGYARRSMDGFGAFILGRNMFGPIRGPWSDESWRGWWGENPPYHAPTFVLTHHPRDPIEMEGEPRSSS